MKLKYEFENVDVENELYAVPVGTSAKEISGLLVLNHCGSVIIDLLKNDTTEEQMITVLAAKYENTIEEVTLYVHKAVSKLRELNLLID